MERWIGSCRRELLDRTLVWNQRDLMTVLHEYEDFYNTHRPHRTMNQAAPLRPLPDGVTDVDHFRVRRRDRAGGVIHEYPLVAQVFGTHNCGKAGSRRRFTASKFSSGFALLSPLVPLAIMALWSRSSFSATTTVAMLSRSMFLYCAGSTLAWLFTACSAAVARSRSWHT